MRVKRIIIMTVLAMIISVFCCGCGKSDPIVGTWKAFDFDYDGTLLSEIDPENDMLKNIKDTTIKAQFFADGSFKMTAGEEQTAGNWESITREADDYPTYNLSPDDDPDTIKATIKDKKLYIEIGWDTMVFKK